MSFLKASYDGVKNDKYLNKCLKDSVFLFAFLKIRKTINVVYSRFKLTLNSIRNVRCIQGNSTLVILISNHFSISLFSPPCAPSVNG